MKQAEAEVASPMIVLFRSHIVSSEDTKAAAMVMSALIIVVACIGFDYQASHFIQWFLP